MKSKCDNCSHNVLSDETSVGAGWVPFCNRGHWGGCAPQDYKDGYCAIWDKCKDFQFLSTPASVGFESLNPSSVPNRQKQRAANKKK